MTFLSRLLALLLPVVAIISAPSDSAGQSRIKVVVKKPQAAEARKYSVPRPYFAGLRIGMSQDSAFLVMRQIAMRSDTMRVDSLLLLESDSISVFGQPAYIQLQIVQRRVKTIVINFHPLAGDRYLNTRDVLNQYMERHFGRGVPLKNESITYRRWETEDGTMEVSYSDKYTRVFLRLGKPQHGA